MNKENIFIPLQSNEHNILRKWNHTDKKFPLDQCLHELIEKQVTRNPDAEAVCFEEAKLCYAELNDRSNQCCHYLRRMGVGPNKVVGVLMERSMEMIIALLGILKSGGAYLPLDPSYPQERLNLILDDAGVSMVLTQKKYEGLVKDFDGTTLNLDSEWSYLTTESETNLENITVPDDLAYVIYTSGSTGKPKGCMISHKAICNRLLWMQEQYQITDQDRILQKTPYTFDVSVWELFLALLSGACLVIAKPKGHQDNHYLIETIRKEQISICHFVPSMLRFFLNQTHVNQCHSLCHVFVSGEALDFDLMTKFKNKLSAKLHNLYGPTEAAVDVTFWKCEEREDKKVPIGRPISNIQIYILDPELRQIPIGETGELYIGGLGLAKGYLNRPGLTEEKFVKNPFSEETDSKLYRTGDKARYLPDGNIEYLGRLDFQVKLRGFRIELGEIETTLNRHESIEQSIVLVKEEDTQDPKLVAYIETKEELVAKQARDFVKRSLPEYMVPNIIVPLESMPVTQHGKIDRNALPWPINERVIGNKNTRQAIEKPKASNVKTEITMELLKYFSEILETNQLKVSDDLFELGATSFTMVQVVEKILDQYGVAIPVEVFLDDPTIEAIADYLETALGNQANHGPQDKTENIREDLDIDPRQNEIPEEVVSPEKVIELEEGNFCEEAYNKVFTNRDYSGKTIPLDSFGRFLSLLKQAIIKQKPRYLYASSGGLNPIQAYIVRAMLMNIFPCFL